MYLKYFPSQLLCKMILVFIQVMAFTFFSSGKSEVSENNPIRFTENKGQWSSDVLFRLRFKSGALFLEKDKLTYLFIEGKNWDDIYNAHHGGNPDEFTINAHAFQVEFMNAGEQVEVSGLNPFAAYENYFIGNDPSKWASNVAVFNGVEYRNIYPGIDLVFGGEKGSLKYSFIVHPGATNSDIQMKYTGVDKIFMENGQLHYNTSVNNIYEKAPFSFQSIDGETLEVPSNFSLSGQVASFSLAEGYHRDYPLVIDPVLVFSTYTGSSADNFGFTATYDNNGNFYAGGIARAAGYPTSIGAFQTVYGGGVTVGNFDLGFDADISITKFNSTGTSIIYSTYLGGSINDQPHSLIVNDLGELHIFGRSNSPNFPVTATAYDNTYNGDMDMVVTKFNATGTALLGSTYIGGSGDDAANISRSPFVTGTLKYNYADDARGDIHLDAAGNIYVASCTQSPDFPTTAGVFQPAFGGAQDGCIIKLNSNCSALLWSSFIGGSNNDAAYSLVLDPAGNIYVAGGTNSPDFSTTPGALNTTYAGGRADGFIVRINSSASTIINSSFIGTASYDQNYFVQLDGDRNVYLLGQTDGSYPVTAGVYTNPNSGQFVTSLSPDLSSVNFSTVFGSGNRMPDISPTAFLVDNCRNIYISGWGGETNNTVGTPGNTYGLPVTGDAYQSTTDGSDFYFLVLSRDAATLRYATYFGGDISNEHVDGGTSRFDKNGVIYQAVCAGCGGNDDFPYTPGAWSQNNNSFNCNLGAAKFEFEALQIDVSVSAFPSTNGCVPFTVELTGISQSAKEYYWDFGDGSTSRDSLLTHTYTDTGTYTITLIGLDTTSCDNISLFDTSMVTITVGDDSIGADFIPNIISSCDSFVAQFSNTSFGIINSYLWSFGDGNFSFSPNPRHEYANPGTYTVSLIVQNPFSCSGADTVTKEITFAPFVSAQIWVNDSSGCAPLTVNFVNESTGGLSYFWDFGNGNTSTLENPTFTFPVVDTVSVSLTIFDPFSCNLIDSARTTIRTNNDSVIADFDYSVLASECDSLVVSFKDQSSKASSLFWSFGDGSSSTLDSIVHIYTYPDSFEIMLIASNPAICNQPDTAFAQVYLPPPVTAKFSVEDGCVPHDAYFQNLSDNAINYKWEFPDGSSVIDRSTFMYFPESGYYEISLTAYNPMTCNDSSTYTASLNVFDLPVAYFTTDSNYYEIFADVFFDNQSTGGLKFVWDFDDGESSFNRDVVHIYRDTGQYYPCLTVTDQNNCDSTYCDTLDITFRGVIDVPNAFSPNGDGINDILFVEGYGVAWMNFRVYNRWGELVFESSRLDHGWDGRYKGTDQEMEVYVYTLDAIFIDGSKSGMRKGNITLLR